MQGVYSSRNAWHAVSSIVKQQGFRGLVKGYWATNSVWFPWNMIYIASYERSRASVAKQLQARALPWLPCPALHCPALLGLVGLVTGCRGHCTVERAWSW